ncbi:MAG: radical SAM protein [Proteobacteria bacterium]|nr:radical SAM protein [Pseudomonadota bacterium]
MADRKLNKACQIRDKVLGRSVFLRGVIEFSNVCVRNCLYCGMRASNRDLRRYQMDAGSLVAAAQEIRADGLGIAMIQGGDDLAYDTGELARAVSEVRRLGLTVLLCIGDRPLQHYELFRAAGAEQAIVKFETSNAELYKQMRPHNSLEDRLELIRGLAAMGYSVSSGCILGLPGSTTSDSIRDLELVKELPLFAASVSPFIPGPSTPLSGYASPPLDSVLDFIAGMRLENPDLLIPAVSALNALATNEGRKTLGLALGLQAGANVVTVNYTPNDARGDYIIYRTARSLVSLDMAIDAARTAGLQLSRPLS